MRKLLDTAIMVVQILAFMETSVTSLVQITVFFLCAIKMAHVSHHVRQRSVRSAMQDSMVRLVNIIVQSIVRITCVPSMDHVRANVMMDILAPDVRLHVLSIVRITCVTNMEDVLGNVPWDILETIVIKRVCHIAVMGCVTRTLDNVKMVCDNNLWTVFLN